MASEGLEAGIEENSLPLGNGIYCTVFQDKV